MDPAHPLPRAARRASDDWKQCDPSALQLLSLHDSLIGSH
jgi:hypothetical protein